MKLKIMLEKDYTNEANMQSQRDSIRDKAEAAGFLVVCTVDGS